jgi:hypothetical protein
MQPFMPFVSIVVKSAAANQCSHKGTEHTEWQCTMVDFIAAVCALCVLLWPLVWSIRVHLCSSQFQYMEQIAARRPLPLWQHAAAGGTASAHDRNGIQYSVFSIQWSVAAAAATDRRTEAAPTLVASANDRKCRLSALINSFTLC